MNFKECLREGMLAETGDIDINRAVEILALTEHKCAFWKEVEAKAQKFPSLFIEGHYEIIKELIVAVLALDGWKAANHDCLFQYILQKKQDMELDFEYLNELRKLRNKIDYHGVKVSTDLWNQNKIRIQMIIETLKQYVKERVK
ncbi:MAG: hypothetical protein HY363_01895 [Candidatus Aenigmarchaeota archaeon]|nr:hypothetical protein [Candidatus Aenigmarchaeota archaeon]